MNEKANEVLRRLRLETVRAPKITYGGEATFQAWCKVCGGGRPHVKRAAAQECVVCGSLTHDPHPGLPPNASTNLGEGGAS